MNYYPLQKLCAVALLSLAASSTVADDIIIHAGTLIDGVSKTPLKQMSIMVRDDNLETSAVTAWKVCVCSNSELRRVQSVRSEAVHHSSMIQVVVSDSESRITADGGERRRHGRGPIGRIQRQPVSV